jgi:hypothetical protein
MALCCWHGAVPARVAQPGGVRHGSAGEHSDRDSFDIQLSIFAARMNRDHRKVKTIPWMPISML